MNSGRWARSLWRALHRVVTGGLVMAYVAVAALGTQHVDPRTLLVTIPVLFLLGAVVGRAAYRHLDPHDTSPLTRFWPAATGGALVVPGFAGIQHLGDRGAYLMLLSIPLVTVVGAAWAYNLELSEASFTPRPGLSGSTVESPESPSHASFPPELPLTPFDALIAEWRSTAEQVHPASGNHQHSATRWKDEDPPQVARRRDPAGFDD